MGFWDIFKKTKPVETITIEDALFGKMDFETANEYFGASYSAFINVPDINKAFTINIESDVPVISKEQKQFFKSIINNFKELELKMHEKLNYKITVSQEDFFSKLTFYKIMLNKPEFKRNKWFASYNTESFGLHYVGFGFEEFDVVEVVIITNEGKEI